MECSSRKRLRDFYELGDAGTFRLYETPDLFYRYENLMRIRWIKTALDAKENDLILDAGCGEGYMIFYGVYKAAYVIGVDIASQKLRSAKKEAKKRELQERVDFIACDAENLPFKNGIFDRVVCSEVLEHLILPERAIEEITRTMKNYAVITIPTGGNTIWKRVRKHLPGYKKLSHDLDYQIKIGIGHIHDFSNLTEFRRLLSKTGLKIVKIIGSSSVDFPGRYLLTNKLPNLMFNLLSRLDDLLDEKPVFREHGAVTVVKCIESTPQTGEPLKPQRFLCLEKDGGRRI